MVYTISLFIAKYFLKIVFAGEGYGQENFPQKKPFIVIFNHNSNFDMFTLALVVKFKAMGMGKYELFQIPVVRWWLRKIHVFPIIRGAGDVEGFERIRKELVKGNVLFMAPEGTRKWADGIPPRPRLGFIRMAQTVGCPVVPVAIMGTRNILPPGARLPRWQKVVVKVGKPVKLRPIEVRQENREQMQKQANAIMRRLYRMLPVWYRPNSPLLKEDDSEDSYWIEDYVETGR